MLVVDASVALKWFLVEPGRPEARRLLDGRDRLIAPELIVAEVVNAVWRRLMTGGIDASQAADVPESLPKMVAELSPMTPLARRALEIAAELQHPAYDCFYLALAEARDASFVTADQRLLRRLVGTAWDERVVGLGH